MSEKIIGWAIYVLDAFMNGNKIPGNVVKEIIENIADHPRASVQHGASRYRFLFHDDVYYPDKEAFKVAIFRSHDNKTATLSVNRGGDITQTESFHRMKFMPELHVTKSGQAIFDRYGKRANAIAAVMRKAAPRPSQRQLEKSFS